MCLVKSPAGSSKILIFESQSPETIFSMSSADAAATTAAKGDIADPAKLKEANAAAEAGKPNVFLH